MENTLKLDSIPEHVPAHLLYEYDYINDPQLLADFKQVLRQSIRADQGFIGWMRDIQNSGTCPVNPTTDASYQAGLQASRQANGAKRSFLGRWNPLARQFGQPRYTASQI